jgi:hypothetical protein
MSLRTDILKRIQKREEANNELHFQIADLHIDIDANNAVIQELQAILKTLPLEEGEDLQPEVVLRKDSDVAKARDILRAVRKPIHVDHLLPKIGKEVTKKNKASLAGQIAIYVRKGQIFTKTEPNTFGLREWEVNGAPKKDEEVVLETVHSGQALPLPTSHTKVLPIDGDEDFPLIPVDEPETGATDKTH